MKRAGTALGTAQGVVVLRSPNGEVPDVGTELVDDTLESVGHVVDIFGPVDQPFLALSATVDHPASLVGEQLYAGD